MWFTAWQETCTSRLPAFPFCQFTEVLQMSRSPHCSILAFSFLGKSGRQCESGFKETCQKENFDSHPETYVPLLNVVMLPDSTVIEHNHCTQTSISLFITISQPKEENNKTHLNFTSLIYFNMLIN